MLVRSDAARARFVRQAFDADIDVACHYDLTVNTAELTPEDGAEIVVLAAQRKAPRRSAAPETPDEFLSNVLSFRRRPRFPRVSEIIWRRCERRMSQSGR